MQNLYCEICGMEINLNNYDFNKNALLQNNSQHIVLSCPFCGVSNKYLKVHGFNMVKALNSDDTASNILDKAVKLEIFNGDFYKKASILAKDQKIKSLFEQLSRIEYMHSRIHMKLGGFKITPVLKEMNYEKYNSDALLMEMASKRELHAVEFYSRYINKINDVNIQYVFNALLNVEKEHIILTRES
ncbi:MAG: metal-iron-binding protein [Clostridiaceae bacterium]|nr:metal-iron-binding protein [Clostridiaceae bacterium]